MRIVVIGGGAIGLLVAGRLARTNHQVAVLARQRTADALAHHHLSITQQQHQDTIPNLTVATTPESLPPLFHAPSLAIVCVKSYDTLATTTTLARLRATHILTLQNGIGNEETLAARFGSDHVIAGAITSSVEPVAPHALVVTKTGGVSFAPMQQTNDITPTVQAFQQAHFVVQLQQEYRSLKWSKALLNMLGNATAAILDMSVEEVYANPRLIALERRAFLEAVAVMQRIGVRPVNLPSYPTALLALLMRHLPTPLLYPLLQKAIAGGRGGKAPSLQRDLQHRRTRTEGEFLYGAIARTANDVGIHAHVNTALWNILHDIVTGNTTWDFFRHKPERLLQIIRT